MFWLKEGIDVVFSLSWDKFVPLLVGIVLAFLPLALELMQHLMRYLFRESVMVPCSVCFTPCTTAVSAVHLAATPAITAP